MSQEGSLTSEHIDVSASNAIEIYYERGWTDGLPVVPAEVHKVEAFLNYANLGPSDVIGVVETRGRVLTAEKIAINAVMAGCRPEYMPVVIAIIEAMTEPQFNWHGSLASTGGSAQFIVINGPIRNQLAINSGVNLFGPGFRANATIGRAIRLIIMNITGGIPGELDKSTFGHGGKYSFCIGENEEISPWEPLHVQRGMKPNESAVSVFAVHPPNQFVDHTSNTPEGLLESAADAMRIYGPNLGECVIVWSPEHSLRFKQAGWTKRRAMEYLYHQAQGTVRQLRENKTDFPQSSQGDQQILKPIVGSPDGISMLVGGGEAGGFSCIIPPWGIGYMSKSVTKKIRV